MRIPSDHLEARPRPDAPARSVPSMPAAQPAPAPLPAQATGGPTQEIGGPSGPLSDARASRAPGQSGASPTGSTRQGPADLDPTRYGDWERNGRCIDF